MGAVPQRASILSLGEDFFAESVAGASKHGSTPRGWGGVWQKGFLPHPSPGGRAPAGAEGPAGSTAASRWAGPGGQGTNLPGTGALSRGMATGWEGLPSPSRLAALHVIFGSECKHVLIRKTKISQCNLGFLYTDGFKLLFAKVSGQ